MLYVMLGFVLVVLAICSVGIWLRSYYDKYNEDYFDARRRGTAGQFRCTQHPLYPGW